MKDVRSLFISDVHLGCKNTNYMELYEFLKSIENTPEYIFLVGDIIDGWRLKSSWKWNPIYNNIIRKILSFAKKGSMVYYITGNHDEFLRDHLYDFDNIKIVNEVVHETKTGKKLLVIHGDRFDSLLRCGNFVNWIGDVGYNALIWLSINLNRIRRMLGFSGHWSLSKAAKESVKKISAYVSRFEDVVVRYTKEKECDGIVCGHIHVPKIGKLQDIDYFNCGDWVENKTAIIENFSGEIYLIEGLTCNKDQIQWQYQIHQ